MRLWLRIILSAIACFVWAIILLGWFDNWTSRPTALETAVLSGDFQAVVKLVADGADVTKQRGHYNTPLVNSFRHEDLSIARHLIANGADLDEPSLLYNAVVRGSIEHIELLLEAGVDPQRNAGRNALHAFRQHGTVEMLEALLAAGADINAKTSYGTTPLVEAISHPDPGIFRAFIAAGADTSALRKSGTWYRLLPLSFVLDEHPAVKKIEMVVSAGADPNARDDDGYTLLHRAASDSDAAAENIMALVEVGANVDAVGGYGTPLHHALEFRNFEVAKSLVKAGADPNVRDKNGHTPLMMAATGSAELLELLIDLGAEVNAKQNHDWTALHYAAAHGDKDIIRVLISRGADPHVVDKDGRTPLEVASISSKLEGNAEALGLLGG